MNTEIESLAVLLKGTLPSSMTDQPAVFIIYVLLVILVGSAVASVVFRNVLFAIASFAVTMAAVAFLYLMLAPFLLFAVQLLVFTTVSAALLIGLLRTTTGLDKSLPSPFGAELIGGAAVAAALLALLVVVVGMTNWPVRAVGPQRSPFSVPIDFGRTITDNYIVGLAVLAVLLASAALGAGLLVTQRARRGAPSSPTTPRLRGRGGPSPRGRHR